MIDELYPQIADRLASHVPELQWTDLDQDQLEFLDQEYAIPFPAAFIDFEDTPWNYLSGGLQRGDVIVRVTLAIEVLEDSYQGSTQRTAALAKLDIAKKIHQALHCWQAVDSGKLVRISSRREKGRCPLPMWVYSQTYKVSVLDASAKVLPHQEAMAELNAKPVKYKQREGADTGYIID